MTRNEKIKKSYLSKKGCFAILLYINTTVSFEINNAKNVESQSIYSILVKQQYQYIVAYSNLWITEPRNL